MPKFMLIVGGANLDKRSGRARAPQILEQYIAWVKKHTEEKRMLQTYKLYDQTGARLTVRGGEVVDGPFVETKEAVGGVFIIDVASLDEARALARDCPGLLLQNAYVEVRAIEMG